MELLTMTCACFRKTSDTTGDQVGRRCHLLVLVTCFRHFDYALRPALRVGLFEDGCVYARCSGPRCCSGAVYLLMIVPLADLEARLCGGGRTR